MASPTGTSDTLTDARERRLALIERLGGLLSDGDVCEVRNRFTGRWTRGFEVVESDATGVRVRRLSDGWVLPARFHAEDCRPT